jgi:hypothetical protein
MEADSVSLGSRARGGASVAGALALRREIDDGEALPTQVTERGLVRHRPLAMVTRALRTTSALRRSAPGCFAG